MSCKIQIPPWVRGALRKASANKSQTERHRVLKLFSDALANHLDPEIQQFWDEMSRVMIAEGDSTERNAFAFMGIRLKGESDDE